MNTESFSKQIRMARAALAWSVRDLAIKAQVSPDTVVRAEKGDSAIRPATWQSLQNALENAGIEFFENGAVIPHSSASSFGIAASPHLPLGVRRIWG